MKLFCHRVVFTIVSVQERPEEELGKLARTLFAIFLCICERGFDPYSSLYSMRVCWVALCSSNASSLEIGEADAV